MKKLPYLEDIYDLETEDLQAVLAQIEQDLKIGAAGLKVELPDGIDSFEKYQRKAMKLKDSLELELEERSQVDNVINFFMNEKKFLDDDDFYKLSEPPKELSKLLSKNVEPTIISQSISGSNTTGPKLPTKMANIDIKTMSFHDHELLKKL